MKRIGVFALTFICITGFSTAVWAGTRSSLKSPGKVRSLKPRNYVFLKLSGPIPERLPLVFIFPPKYKTHRQILDVLAKARNDKNIRGIFVYIAGPQLGWARAQEIRSALNSCRFAGKRVVCFMEGGGNLEYYIASVADRLAIVPTSSVMLIGLRAEVMFFKGLMDKLGIKADFIQVGRYKGAAEPFTRENMSKSFRESMEVLLEDYYEQMVRGIASGRDLKRGIVRALIDRGPYTARSAQEAGLVDDVLYYDQFLQRLRAEAPGSFRIIRGYGEKTTKPLTPGSPQQMMNLLFGMARPRKQQIPVRGNNIALIYAIGPIVSGQQQENIFGEQVVTVGKLVRALRIARRHPGIKAVVMRINSPGGSAVASDIIWREIARTNKVKPVIVSMSDVAASGGYYLAAAARIIVADPGTITGSIGVVSGKLNLKGLYNKLGISVSVIERGRNASLLSSVSSFSENQRRRMEQMALQTYRDFVARVAVGRKKTIPQIDTVAQGRAWSGARARSVGLVDKIGGLELAIRIAKKEAKIPDSQPVNIVELPRSRNIFEILLSGGLISARVPVEGINIRGLPLSLPFTVRVLNEILSKEHIAWMLPYDMVVH